MKSRKYTNLIYLFVMNLFLMLLAYGGFWREGFGADTISQFVDPLINIDSWITYGRFLSYVLSFALYKIGINTVYYYHIFYLIFILCVTVALTIYQTVFLNLLKKGEKEDVKILSKEAAFVCLTVAIIFVNGLFCENYMFPECFLGFGLAFAVSALGVMLITKKRYAAGIIVLIISATFYQAPVMVAAIVLVGYYYIEKKGNVDFEDILKYIGIIVAASLIVLGTTFIGGLFADLMGDHPKPIGFRGVKEEILSVFGGLYKFLNSGYNLMPPLFFPLTVIAIAVVVLAFGGFFEKGKKLVFYIITAAVMFAAALILTRGDATPRLLGGLYAALSMVVMVSVILINGDRYKNLIACAAVVFLILQICMTNTIMMNHYISNTQDKEIGSLAYEQVVKYETETGNTVTKIACMNDARAKSTWPYVYYRCGQINERVLPLVPYSLLVYSSDGRTFEKIQMDKDIKKKYFKDKDWSSFNPDEQMVFVDDTLYWCIY